MSWVRDRILGLRRVPASELRAHPKNWRIHPPAQREALSEVLARVGYADAVLARPTPDGLEIIDGHLRAETTPDQDIPVLIVDLDDEEADLVLATHDPIGAMAGADADAIAALLDDLALDPGPLRDLLTELAESAEDSKPWADRIDTLPDLSGDVRTHPGDLWELEEHRLLCGDATQAEDVARLMGDRKAALFATDPPYCVDYTGSDRPTKGKDWSGVYREVEIADVDAFFRSTFANALEHLAPDAPWYTWHAHKRASLISSMWEELGVITHQQIIWVKPTALHGFSFYPWQHEPCLMGWRRGHKPRHDGDNSSVTSVWSVDWEGKARIVGNLHSTQKPTEIFAIPMRKHTRIGEVCYEPFSGSGTQIMAAELERRVCYALEIEPRFCDLAINRWQELTGKTAKLVSRGA